MLADKGGAYKRSSRMEPSPMRAFAFLALLAVAPAVGAGQAAAAHGCRADTLRAPIVRAMAYRLSDRAGLPHPRSACVRGSSLKA